MDAALILATSALAGQVIRGLASGFTTLVEQRTQARAGQAAHDLAGRGSDQGLGHRGVEDLRRLDGQQRSPMREIVVL